MFPPLQAYEELNLSVEEIRIIIWLSLGKRIWMSPLCHKDFGVEESEATN